MSTITAIRKRLEAKAGADAGTRPYWDCVEALLDVAEAAALNDAITHSGGETCDGSSGAPACVLHATLNRLIPQKEVN